MTPAEEFQLQEYQDLGIYGEHADIRMKRHPGDGRICLEKRVPLGQKSIYQFLQEACVPGVPEIFLCAEDGEKLIVIEKYIEGKNIETLLEKGPLSWQQTLTMVDGICETLKGLHQATPPVICRDVKAENIVVDENGTPWLVDFDIARVFAAGKKKDTELLGTAEYAAPEQFGFFQTDQRTDIYALGVLMNYMSTGKFPVEEMVHGRMGDIVRKCTHLEPKQRYQNIEELQKDLFQLQQDLGMHISGMQESRVSVLPPGFRSGKWKNRVLGGIGYLLLTWFCFSLELSREEVVLTGLNLRFEQAAIWLSQILFIFYLFRYRGWGNRIPLLRSGNLFLRIAGLAVLWWALICGAAVLCALKDMLFF